MRTPLCRVLSMYPLFLLRHRPRSALDLQILALYFVLVEASEIIVFCVVVGAVFLIDLGVVSRTMMCGHSIGGFWAEHRTI